MKIRFSSLGLTPPQRYFCRWADKSEIDKAGNAFMIICAALVLSKTLPGIVLFYSA
ncbi:MAG: hypothetical protein ACSLEL_03780 [Candidatus Malihini olakiniferum]